MKTSFTNLTSTNPEEEAHRTEFRQREAVSYFSVYLNIGMGLIIIALIMFMIGNKIDKLETRINKLEQQHVTGG